MKNKELKKNIESWRNQVGFQFINKPDNIPINDAMSIGTSSFKSMDIDTLCDHLVILDSYYTFLSAEMGRIYSRVRFTENEIERVKLNQIKPFVEAVKVKIDLYKKIYDGKLQEVKWRMYASSDRG